jgi:hypothetical protein
VYSDPDSRMRLTDNLLINVKFTDINFVDAMFIDIND